MDKALFDEIFDNYVYAFLKEICDNNSQLKMKNYDECKNHIFQEYVNAKSRYKESVLQDEGCLLDRHKIAACMCYAVLKISVFDKSEMVRRLKSSGQKVMGIFYYANELAAYVIATEILSMFMMLDYNDESVKDAILTEFPVSPKATMCKTSFLNSVLFDLSQIKDDHQIGIEKFDMYAYSMLFFMLEVYFVDYLKCNGKEGK